MPFKSEKQRKYMHANHPDIAKRWEKDYKKGKLVGNQSKLDVAKPLGTLDAKDFKKLGGKK